MKRYDIYFHNLVQIEGPIQCVEMFQKMLTDPSRVFNPNAILPMPESIAQGNWENLGRHWQKTHWGFQGYPEVKSGSFSSFSTTNHAKCSYHLITNGGPADKLWLALSQQFPLIEIETVACQTKPDSSICIPIFRQFAEGKEIVAEQDETTPMGMLLMRVWQQHPTVTTRSQFIPLEPPPTEDFAKHCETIHTTICQSLAIPVELLTKEEKSGIYQALATHVNESLEIKTLIDRARARAKIGEADSDQVDGGRCSSISQADSATDGGVSTSGDAGSSHNTHDRVVVHGCDHHYHQRQP